LLMATEDAQVVNMDIKEGNIGIFASPPGAIVQDVLKEKK